MLSNHEIRGSIPHGAEVSRHEHALHVGAHDGNLQAHSGNLQCSIGRHVLIHGVEEGHSCHVVGFVLK